MEKNKMMRTAAGLLVVTVATSGVLFGTFAKYITTNSGADSARVAKFGVTIQVNDDMGLFKTSYDTGSDDTSANTVVSANTDRKIAPGTKGSMSFSITGKPEVATKLEAVVSNEKAVKLEAKSGEQYKQYRLDAGKFAEKECTVTMQKDYEPIKWYFGEQAITDNTQYNMTLDDLKTTLEKLTTVRNDPNVELDKTYHIGWKWDFEPEQDVKGTWDYLGGVAAPYSGAAISDFLDTYLGDEETPQTESFDLKLTITQID